MKKTTLLVACVFTFVFFAGSSFTSQPPQSIQPVLHTETHKQALVNYIWFTDVDLTDPVGMICDINTEINRLRNLFPGYTFSAYNTSGLHAFEFGYFPLLSIAIIYSDIDLV